MNAIDRVLHGAIDLHTHSGPSPMPRRITHVEAARQASDAGFRAILVKCHYHSTVPDIMAVSPYLEGIDTSLYGGVALNSVTGGLNVHAVDLSLKLGGKMVWFPTISSAAHIEHASIDDTTRSHFTPLGMLPQEEVPVLDGAGAVLPEVRTILELTRDAGVMVSTGHLGAEAATAVIEAAVEIGQRRILVSHPNYIAGIDHALAGRLAGLGVTFEHEIGMYDNDKLFPLEVLLGWIDAVGPEHTVLGSDLGQTGNQLPVEGYRSLLPRLLDAGISEADLKLMIGGNQLHLLGLES